LGVNPPRVRVLVPATARAVSSVVKATATALPAAIEQTPPLKLLPPEKAMDFIPVVVTLVPEARAKQSAVPVGTPAVVAKRPMSKPPPADAAVSTWYSIFFIVGLRVVQGNHAPAFACPAVAMVRGTVLL
jgi:sorbitol-specific phosphotransferase system component IIBC